jgi:AcrR family transcriptional regulator
MIARAEKQEQTRLTILEAMKKAIMTTAYPSIRIADVAATAGVSAQTVHTHFESKEALFLSAIGELGQELLEMRGETAPGDVVAIARGLVAEYERYGDVNWALLPLERDSPAVAAALQVGRAEHRAWLEVGFAPLLPLHPTRRHQVLHGLYAATDVGTWKLLRRDLGLSQARTRAVIEMLIRGVLATAEDGG